MFELVTVQANTFRCLFEVLTNILTDINMQVDKNGLRISATDSSHVSLVYVLIRGDKLESFKCTRPHTIGLNIPTLHKVLKTAKNTDTLTLRLLDTNMDELQVEMSNTERQTHSAWGVKLLDLDDESLVMPDLESKRTVTMSSAEFQEIMKDFASFHDSVRIVVDGGRITFGCDGDAVSCEKTLQNTAPPPKAKKAATKTKKAQKPQKKAKKLKKCAFIDDEAEDEDGEEDEEEEEEEPEEEPEEEAEGSGDDLVGPGRIPIRIQGGSGGTYSAEFAIKFLSLFAKAAYLSNAVHIFVHDSDFPIIFKYIIASMGELRMCLAPKIHDVDVQ